MILIVKIKNIQIAIILYYSICTNGRERDPQDDAAAMMFDGCQSALKLKSFSMQGNLTLLSSYLSGRLLNKQCRKKYSEGLSFKPLSDSTNKPFKLIAHRLTNTHIQ